MNAFEYVTADSFAAAVGYLADAKPGETLVKAGGIDVIDRLKEGIDQPRVVLNIGKLYDAQKAITRGDDGSLVISALARLVDISQNPLVRERLPALSHAADEAATPQVRNVATVGGNLCQKPRCWYYRCQDFQCLKKGGSTCYAVEGDNRYHAVLGAGACHIVHPSNLAVALVACNAQLHLVRQDKNASDKNGADKNKLATRIVPADEFFRVPSDPTQDENVLAPGELIEKIVIAKTDCGKRSAYVEIGHKQSYDWALASCAVNWNNAAKPRIVLGAVAPIPWRVKSVETLLAGQKLSDDLIAKAKRTAVEGAKPMTRNGYKLHLVQVALERALRQAAE